MLDKNKLTKAFKEMRKEHLFARQNFQCCRSCGLAAINEEKEVGAGKIGYVFYHQQDAQNLNDGKNLYMAFGALVDKDENRNDRAVQVGVRVVQILERNGVRTNWDGSIGSRIMVVATQ